MPYTRHVEFGVCPTRLGFEVKPELLPEAFLGSSHFHTTSERFELQTSSGYGTTQQHGRDWLEWGRRRLEECQPSGWGEFLLQ